MNYVIPLAQARRAALHSQLLAGPSDSPNGTDGAGQTVESLGYVQIDTISVVERAHHHTLWNRGADYTPDMLDTLLAHERRVFEYWGHAASYLPMSDYRYYTRKMAAYRDPTSSWVQRRLAESEHLLEPIMERIRAEGPLMSSDFDAPPGKQSAGWWDWKPAKVALEVLFSQGELMVSERRNFQRVYDLAERVLPSDVDTTMPEETEIGEYVVRRALAAHGFATEREIHFYLRLVGRPAVASALKRLQEAGQLVSLQIEEIEDAVYYAFPTILDQVEAPAEVPPRLALLSPFDNAIIDRDRVRTLFGFDYSIECYTPAAKRQYGYFTLPILWQDQLVGRLDPKADRKSRILIVRSLHLEPGFDADDPFLNALAQELAAFARFNGCDAVKIETIVPQRGNAKRKRMLERFLALAM